MNAAIFLPALFSVVFAQRGVFSVAGNLKFVPWDPRENEGLPGGFGPLVSKRQIVLGRPAIVAESLQQKRCMRKRLEGREHDRGIGRNFVPGILNEIGFVEVE